MRVYVVTKKTVTKALFLMLVVSLSVAVTLPYRQAVVNVFNPTREVPIYSVDIPQKKIAITFDCAWGGEDIPQLMEILKKYDAKATFFAVGSWMDKYKDNIVALDKAGHEIANHTDTHPDMTTISEEKMKAEIESANKKIEALTGKKNILFRPSYGAYNDKVIKTAKSMGQYTIQWDVDSLDWKELGVDPMVSRVNEKVQNGSIILFHNDTKYTLQALPTILDKLKSQGYEFVKVSDLILKDNFYLDHEGRQHTLIKEQASID